MIIQETTLCWIVRPGIIVKDLAYKHGLINMANNTADEVITTFIHKR